MKASIDEISVKVGEGIAFRVTVGPVSVNTPVMPFSAAKLMGAALATGEIDEGFLDLLLEKTGHVAEFNKEELSDVGIIVLTMIPK